MILFGLDLSGALEIWGARTVVGEDRGGQGSGLPVVPRGALAGILVWSGYVVKASMYGAGHKIRFLRVVVDFDVDRLEV